MMHGQKNIKLLNNMYINIGANNGSEKL